MEPLKTESLTQFNNLNLIKDIDLLRAEVDRLRPLSREQENRIMQKFKLDWNYNSNAIEGNSLDYGETAAFLMQGITAKGKPLKDYLDIKGHNEAIDYLSYIIKNKEELSERDIRSLHEMLLVEPYESPAQTIEGVQVQKRIRIGEYKRTANHVKTITGEIHYYASPEDTPILMGELIEWYRSVTAEAVLHPVIIAAVFHHRFTSIHPFDDGNGRMSRLLMNLILMQYGYPPVIVKNTDKNEYYLTLSQADTGDIEPFINFIADNLISSLNIYIRGAKGESIEEPSDLRKKIVLFKKEIEARRDKIEIKRTIDSQREILNTSILPLINELKIVLGDFKDLFFNYNEYQTELDKTAEPEWIYYEQDAVEYIKEEFSKDVEDVIYIISFNFLKFKLAENSFSTEVKIAFQLKELSYCVFYDVSEDDELKRISRTLYSQWLNSDYIEKYYHQNISAEEISKFTNKIGEEFFQYNKSVFENPELLNVSITNNMVRDLWKQFTENYKGVAQSKIFLIKEIAEVLVYSRESRVDIRIPENIYPKLTTRNKVDIEKDFSIFLHKNIKTARKIFVYISVKSTM